MHVIIPFCFDQTSNYNWSLSCQLLSIFLIHNTLAICIILGMLRQVLALTAFFSSVVAGMQIVW